MRWLEWHIKHINFVSTRQKNRKNFLVKTFGCVRFVYNKMLAERKETYEKFKDNKALLKKQKLPTPAKYKKEFEWLKEVDSLGTRKRPNEPANGVFQFLFRQGRSIQNSRIANRNNPTRQIWSTETSSFWMAHIKLPKLKPLRMKQHREIPSHHVIKSCTISRSVTGKYHISILTEYEHNPEQKRNQSCSRIGFCHEWTVCRERKG